MPWRKASRNFDARRLCPTRCPRFMKDVHRQGLLEFALVMAGPRRHLLADFKQADYCMSSSESPLPNARTSKLVSAQWTQL